MFNASIQFRIKNNSVFATSDFIAELKFYTSEFGGRKTAAVTGYRPHLEFKEYPGLITTGQQIYLGQDKVEPGETVLAKISIVNN